MSRGRPVEWAMASSVPPLSGVNRALTLAKPLAQGALVGLVSGVGALEEAAATARTAAAILRRYANQTLGALVKRCHRNLMMSRGVMLVLGAFDGPTAQLSWVGVGNLEARLWRARPQAKPRLERLRCLEGVVGYYLPPLPQSRLALEPGDTLVLGNTELPAPFEPNLHEPLQPMADRLVQARGTREAVVLLARYLGRNHEPPG